MHIALVSQEYPPETAHGGIATQTHAKAHGLAALGHGVCVISHSTDDVRHETSDGRVRVVRVPGYDRALPTCTEAARWHTWSACVAGELASLHAEAPFDLVDFPEWGGEGYVHLLNRTAFNHVPTVVHLHGPLVMLAHTLGWPDADSELYRVGTHMEATCVRLADRVYSSGACSADWCAERYGVSRDSIPVLHTGLDTETFAPREVPKDVRPTVLYVGRVAESKGALVLLDAALRLVEEFVDLRLRVIGDGEEDFVETLRRKAIDAGCPDLLDLVGFVERAALPEHLSRAHVVAAPSFYEGGPGFVCLEAMACAVPVVTCTGSGAAEHVSDGRTGLLVPPRDVDALDWALGRLLRDPAERETLGAQAREYVVAEADSLRCIGAIENLYASVLRDAVRRFGGG